MTLSPGQAVSPDFGLALGNGPVFAVGLGTEGLLRAYDSPFAGWQGNKVLWIIDPRYLGPVVIRGRQLDGPGEVRFAYRGTSPEPGIWLGAVTRQE